MQSATQVYVAGEMMITADGYKTISKSDFKKKINWNLLMLNLQSRYAINSSRS